MLDNSTNNTPICLALDAMGGDHAPHSVVMGAAEFIKNHSNVTFLFFGDANQISPILNKFYKLYFSRSTKVRIVFTNRILVCKSATKGIKLL